MSFSRQKIGSAIIRSIAMATRKFHPRGTERILRTFHHPDRVSGVEAVIPYDGDLRIHTNTASFIEWEIFFKGYYAKNIIDLIKKYLPRDGAFVDVGANVGAYTLIAAKIAREVIAIEPVPEIASRLQENCSLNNLANVKIVRFVISDTEGKTQLYIPEIDANKSSSVYDAKASGARHITSDVTTLDALLAGKKIDFIKIDVEGHDRNVIMGAREIIKKYKPIIVFEECGDEAPTEISKETIDQLFKEAGYEQIQIGDQDILCLPKRTA